MSSNVAEVAQMVSTTLVGRTASVAARFTYRLEDPFAVCVVFSVGEAQVCWTFARELLRDGLSAPAGQGDILVAPAGAARVTLTLRSGSGLAMLACDRAELVEFVQRIYEMVPEGRESTHIALDRFLADII